VPASDKNLFDQFAVLGIQTTTVRHSPMFTVEDGEKLLVDVPGGHCKTLFLKGKKGDLWLVVMLGNIRLDMKILQKKTGFFTTVIRKTRFDEGGPGSRTRRGNTLCPFE